MVAFQQLIRKYPSVKPCLTPIFGISVHHFDSNFAELAKSTVIENAIEKVNDILARATNFLDVSNCRAVLFALQVILRLKFGLLVIFERKLFTNEGNYKSLCRNLSGFFSKLHINNNLDTSLVCLCELFSSIADFDDSANPIRLTIAVHYFLWYLCQKYEINSTDKLLDFLAKINGSVLIYCNSPTVNFDVLHFPYVDLIIN